MKKLLLLALCLTTTAMTANAYVDNQYMTTEQYILNTGGSKEIARLVQTKMTDPYAPLPEKEDTRTIPYKILNYIDPASCGDYQFPWNRSKFYANWEDL